MIEVDFTKLFTPYLKSDASKNSWYEMELVEDAPALAISAFAQYKEMEKWARENGIEL